MKIFERIIQAMNLKHTKSNQTLHLYKDNWVRFEFNYRIHIGQWIITHNASLNNGKHSQSIQLAMEWLDCYRNWIKEILVAHRWI